MGRAERGVVLLVLGLGVAGHAVRYWAGPGPAPGDVVALPGTRTPPSDQRTRAVSESRPLAPGEQLDPDRATAVELARLPGLGMRRAKEIVSDREIRGPFGSAEALLRVDGIGPATVRRLEPFLRFAVAASTAGDRVDLNSATEAELQTLPGVGPSRARAILAYRERHGPFADPSDLARVPGIGGRTAARLAPLVRVRRRVRRGRRTGASPREAHDLRENDRDHSCH